MDLVPGVVRRDQRGDGDPDKRARGWVCPSCTLGLASILGGSGKFTEESRGTPKGSRPLVRRSRFPKCHPVGGQQDLPSGRQQHLPADGELVTVRDRDRWAPVLAEDMAS